MGKRILTGFFISFTLVFITSTVFGQVTKPTTPIK
jgi:hypothetical protein